MAQIFQVLNQPEAERSSALDEDLASLTYVNGDLFAEPLLIPSCNEHVWNALLEASAFNWSSISPAIFGSLFQNVMTPKERRQLGAHYTTEENILRVIRPLFLDELKSELAAAKSRAKLEAFHRRISELTFFDPACGCGNFLVVTYRELRRLETKCLRKLGAKDKNAQGQLALDLKLRCRVNVDQFYGIEIEEFPALIARTALYLADHLANREISSEFGQAFARFPIPTSPHIHIANALRIDWNEVLPAEHCDYVYGNPPFAGHTTRSKEQSEDLQLVWGSHYAKWLDYVTGWYRKFLDYDASGSRSLHAAFVSTSSISQGEQVGRLWGPLLEAGYGIDFAYSTYGWTSEAKGMAHVHVVIIGFSHEGRRRPTLYSVVEGEQTLVQPVTNISPYLVEGPSLVVLGRSIPISAEMPPVRYGSLPSDGGGLVVDPSEFPDDEVAARYLRPYFGSNEVVKGLDRWVIWMPHGPEPGDLAKSEFLRDRLDRVRTARLASRNPDTRALADVPYKWFHEAQPRSNYIGIPAQVSETRRWYTVAYFTPDVIASNTLYTALDPDGFLFGILSSAMFIAWLRAVGGRLEARLRYAKSIVHNTYPLPDLIPDKIRTRIVESGWRILEVRERHPGASLADLYDPLGMPPDLRDAHQKLDKAVDAAYGRHKHTSDESRLRVLFARYAELTGGDVTLFEDEGTAS